MNRRLKIILLSPYLPAYNTSACAKKIYDFIVRFHREGHCLYVFSFCDRNDQEKIKLIRPFCKLLRIHLLKDYSRYPSRARDFTKKVREVFRDEGIDLLQCEKSYMSRYLPRGLNGRSVLVEHEILSGSFEENARIECGLVQKMILYLRARKKIFEEASWYSRFKRIIVFSDEDKQLIRSRHNPQARIDIIPLGIDLKEYSLTSGHSDKVYDLAYIGNYSHRQNIDAVLYFCAEILPLIKKKRPGVKMIIAGANPPRSLEELTRADKNIFLAGYVDNIKTVYADSKILVAPIRYGRGMRYKFLEAMALGVPVISTSVGARGAGFTQAFRIADAPSQFADDVIRLLRDSEGYKKLAAGGHSAVMKYFNLEEVLGRHKILYAQLLSE